MVDIRLDEDDALVVRGNGRVIDDVEDLVERPYTHVALRRADAEQDASPAGAILVVGPHALVRPRDARD